MKLGELIEVLEEIEENVGPEVEVYKSKLPESRTMSVGMGEVASVDRLPVNDVTFKSEHSFEAANENMTTWVEL